MGSKTCFVSLVCLCTAISVTLHGCDDNFKELLTEDNSTGQNPPSSPNNGSSTPNSTNGPSNGTDEAPMNETQGPSNDTDEVRMIWLSRNKTQGPSNGTDIA